MASDNKYVWTEREQRDDLVVCPDCEADNDRSQLRCDGCNSMLIETDVEELNDNFVAEQTGRFLSEPPEARDEELGRLLDKVFWFIRNWVWALLLSVMSVVFHIGLFGGIIALLWWHFEDGSIRPAAVLLGIGFGTLLLFGLLNKFGVFDWIYCESAF